MNRLIAIPALCLLFGLLTPALVSADGSAGMPQMLVEVPSPYGFDETLEKLEAKAKDMGWKVPSKWKVNFQANLLNVTGIDVGPNKVIKMCAPEPAAKLLVKDEYKVLTAMMPCTLAVYVKSDGKTYISMLDLEVMGAMYGGDVADMAKELGPQMKEMVNLE